MDVTGDLPVKGGVLRVVLVPGDGRNQIQEVQFSGPFRDEPPGARQRLEKLLASASIDQAPARIESFFAQNQGALPGVEPEDFLTVLTLAFMKVRRTTSSAPDPTAWKKQT